MQNLTSFVVSMCGAFTATRLVPPLFPAHQSLKNSARSEYKNLDLQLGFLGPNDFYQVAFQGLVVRFLFHEWPSNYHITFSAGSIRMAHVSMWVSENRVVPPTWQFE
jgi:hypothetical protein